MTLEPTQMNKTEIDQWRIALYYIYVDLENHVDEQLELHQKLCQDLELQGRIRISTEGVNGVLSGKRIQLQEYEECVTRSLERISGTSIDLDVKYCHLREDIPIESQLFDSLMVKRTQSVISLFDYEPPPATKKNRRRRQKEMMEQEEEKKSGDSASFDLKEHQKSMMKHNPSPHLSAEEWNAKLLDAKKDTSLLVDVRNVYESRVGHFSAPEVPTLLTNTRKYSDLPELLANNPHVQKSEKIFAYCTGGVRCERVSMLIQSLYPEKEIYQLQGGIQSYLEFQASKGEGHNEDSLNLFRGKNFVFDPRRTDPTHGPDAVVGKCLVCCAPHDDYDNGHAPSEGKEARCNVCRMLVLVCNDCRPKYACWGEEAMEERPLLFCGTTNCVHEGAAPIPELI
eukprot:CAMPEP_0176154546 /NCGR_PEP_ID=MMETSP0120_2-20121206/78955_1 /TAXON_ID=160619 /ORGANISM="Kryptoperidinium foliaceum, Strain CCMP 1326" /LENGTH=396 /DNA_ID=CAMNT_0017491643 /DNA_START=206 /DNA_END=1396 /DNA_ORIENTATION=+